jgi:hypothetical protein
MKMSETQSKRSISTCSNKLSGKSYNDRYESVIRRSNKRSPSLSQSDGIDQTMKHRLRNYRRHSPYDLRESKARPVHYTVLLVNQHSTIEKTDISLKENIRSTTVDFPEKLCGTSSEKKSQSIDTIKYQSDGSFDRITKDEIIRKASTCLSFYGNFVIIPAIEKTLEKIENIEKNVIFSYWHEIITFIDSYDLPYASESRKKLVDDLVEKITVYVENEGISAHDWQTIICTLPNDVSSKFDHRLEDSVMAEVATLAEQDQLPFNLSKPIHQLLRSAKKHAGKYIRNSKK